MSSSLCNNVNKTAWLDAMLRQCVSLVWQRLESREPQHLESLLLWYPFHPPLLLSLYRRVLRVCRQQHHELCLCVVSSVCSSSLITAPSVLINNFQPFVHCHRHISGCFSTGSRAFFNNLTPSSSLKLSNNSSECVVSHTSLGLKGSRHSVPYCTGNWLV